MSSFILLFIPSFWILLVLNWRNNNMFSSLLWIVKYKFSKLLWSFEDNRSYVPKWTIFLPILYVFSFINVKLSECLIFINQVIIGRRHVGIMSAEPVGNYGVRYLRLKLCVHIFFFFSLCWCKLLTLTCS